MFGAALKPKPAHAVFPSVVAAALPIGSTILKTAAGQFVMRNAVNIVGAALTGLAVLYSQNPDSPNPLAIGQLFIPFKDDATQQYSVGSVNNVTGTGTATRYHYVLRRTWYTNTTARCNGSLAATQPSDAVVSRTEPAPAAACSTSLVQSTYWQYSEYFPTNPATGEVQYSTGNPDSDSQVAELDRTSSGFALPNDSDLVGVAGGSSGRPIVSPSAVQTQYLNDQGNPAILEVSRNSDGSTTLVESVQNGTQVERTTVNVSSSGTVNSVGTTSAAGALSPVQTVSSPSQTAVTSPTVGAVTGGAASAVEFPSDYARSGEAQIAAQTVVTGMLAGEVTAPVVVDSDMPWFGETFEPLSGFQINTAGATCPVWQFDALDENFYIDHHCVLIQDFNALFYAMFTAFWVLLAIRTVMEA